MIKKSKKLLIPILFSFLLIGCNNTNSDNNDVNPNPPIGGDIGGEEDNPIQNELTTLNDFLTYQDLDETMTYGGFTPSSGDIDILLVPVEFSDLPNFSDSELKMIDETFNNESPSYFESVSSYYYKASYGKLNLNFVMTDVYESSLTSSQFKRYEVSGNGTPILLDDMYNSLTIDGQRIKYYEYDKDIDGYVDGVWMIYNNANKEEVFVNSDYWAYTSYLGGEKDYNNPTFNTFANCSKYFLYQGNSSGYDAHTLIHETGHMLGLEDYYSYDITYSASGGLMMMDLNIGDHDSFSKFSLDWVNPYLYNKQTKVTLKPFASTGECLIIPSGNSFYNNPFGEYLILEYYTPTNLNYFDSTSKYSDRPYLYSESGLIIYHIDARLVEVRNNRASFIHSDNIDFSKTYSFNDYIYTAYSNTHSYSEISSTNNLIEIVSATNINMYDSGFSNNDSLFKLNDSFDSSSFTSFFRNDLFNDGSKVNINFTITSLDESGITLEFN